MFTLNGRRKLRQAGAVPFKTVVVVGWAWPARQETACGEGGERWGAQRADARCDASGCRQHLREALQHGQVREQLRLRPRV
ncbi:hypothetical protein, partial [Immundisolibacter sp.]|uniref:hypothetical protein n=1 Tax=Immundisolibacter sp. TaxID=1934948 RepID=UPI003564CD1D